MAGPPDRRSSRSRLDGADLAAAWDDHAADWVAWARSPGHDYYWRFHRDIFLDLVPAAARATLDLGCGEGRLARDLSRLGHSVVGVDRSPAMIAAARAASPAIRFEVADAVALPFPDESYDCVVAFMSLQDIQDLEGVVGEAARVLAEGGRLCFAVVHPLNSAGKFASNEADAPFVIAGSYLDRSSYSDWQMRDGLQMTFVSEHRSIAAYTGALASAGFLIERLAEPALPEYAVADERSRRWKRLPLFLHGRAVKLACPPPVR
jgi:SAM-dependent methyltransferase